MKRTTIIDWESIMIYIDSGSKMALYEQIYEQIKEQIISGALASDEKLDSIRNLSKKLGVSKNTVDLAYRQLISEGYIYSKMNSGFYVEKYESYKLNVTSSTANVTGRNLSVTGRSSNSTDRAISGTGRSSNGTDRTISGTGRSSNSTDRTISGTGRSSNSTDRTISVTGRSSNSTDRTISGTGRSSNSTDRTISVTGRSSNGTDRTISGTGRSSNDTDRTISGTGRSSNGTDRTISGTGRSSNGTDRAISGTGRTLNVTGRSLNGAIASAASFKAQNRVRNFKYRFVADSINHEEFDWKKWKNCLNEALYEEELDFTGYEDPRGDIKLRRELKKLLFENKNIVCSEEQIVICGGSMYALDIAIKLINSSASDKIHAVSDSYVPRTVVNAFLAYGIRLNESDLNDDTDVIYCSPSNQFITGRRMGVESRRSMAAYIDEHDVFFIENDSDNELLIGMNCIPSVYSFVNDSDKMFYIGSVAGVMSPMIRIAYMVIPEKFVKVFCDMYEGFRTSIPMLHQRSLQHYIASGDMYRHVRRMTVLAEKKRKNVYEVLHELENDGYIQITGDSTGGYFVISICDEKQPGGFVAYARECGIEVKEYEGYYFIGYLSIKIESLGDALDVLKKCIINYR